MAAFRIDGDNVRIIGSTAFWINNSAPPGAMGVFITRPTKNLVLIGNSLVGVPPERMIVQVGTPEPNNYVQGNPGASFLAPMQPQASAPGDPRPATNTGRSVGAEPAPADGHVGAAPHSFVAGLRNMALGYGAVALGVGNVADGPHSFAGGHNAWSRGMAGKHSWGSGNFRTTGDAQIAVHIARAVTVSTQPTRLTSDGHAPNRANSLVLPVANGGSAFLATVRVIGRNQTTGAAGTWLLQDLLISRSSTPDMTKIIGEPAFVPGPGAPAIGGPILEVAPDTLLGALSISVQSASSDRWHWVAEIRTVEVQ